jgi:hypothetical protein
MINQSIRIKPKYDVTISISVVSISNAPSKRRSNKKEEIKVMKGMNFIEEKS